MHRIMVFEFLLTVIIVAILFYSAFIDKLNLKLSKISTCSGKVYLLIPDPASCPLPKAEPWTQPMVANSVPIVTSQVKFIWKQQFSSLESLCWIS